jgi:hypothetical protein
MFTQAERYELKRSIADIVNDAGLPPYLKVNRLAELLEDRLIAKGLEIAAFEGSITHRQPPDRPPTRKQPARKRPAKRQNAQSTRAAAATRKKG